MEEFNTEYPINGIMKNFYIKALIFSLSTIVIYGVLYELFSSIESQPSINSPINFVGLFMFIHLAISVLGALGITEKVSSL